MIRRAWSQYPSIVMYSHDGFGLGHLSRTVYLAECIRERSPTADILILTSSPAAHRFSPLDDFEYVKLPSVTKIGVERYQPHNLRSGLKSVIALRSSLLLTTVQHMRPDLLIVDHRPLGLKGEVLPTLQWIRKASPTTRTAVGLRDIVDDAATVKMQWREQGIYGALEDYYDQILVYGDRSVFDSVNEYELSEAVARKVQFTGYLGRTRINLSREEVRGRLRLGEERLIVVHVGGGGDGASLIGTYLDCAHMLPENTYSLVVTGPLMDRKERENLYNRSRSSQVRIVDYQDDLLSYVAASDLTITMGGYNSVTELLSVGTRSLIVPRVYPRVEQYLRAELLRSRGRLEVLDPRELCVPVLVERIRASFIAPPPRGQPVALEGGPRAAELLASLLPSSGTTQERSNMISRLLSH